MNLAIVGIRGLPNSYGGFETLAEYLVEHLADEIDITVYCSSTDMKSRLQYYKGAKLKYIPISSHGMSGIIYDSISLLRAISKKDKVLFLGFGAGFIVPFLKEKSKIILNIGGLDWKRSKWPTLAQKAIKISEALLVKYSGKIISDNIGIQQYLLKEYKRESTLIAYGGDQANYRPVTKVFKEQYPFLKEPYAFTVTRIQSDNNVEMILEAFMHQNELPIVIVGNWDNSVYGKKLRDKYKNISNIVLLDAIYDRDILDVLRSNCALYIHGHSAGGTNPSLAEAMYLSLPVFAFASGYNEHTTERKALYFRNAKELCELVRQFRQLPLKEIGSNMKSIANEKYLWKTIAAKYKEVMYQDS